MTRPGLTVLLPLLGLTAALADPAPAPLVDRFGQSNRVEYPGKIHSEDELRADGVKETGELEQPGNSSLDQYGGLAGSQQSINLRKTGYFHVEQAAGRWMFVTPEGNAFFQLGVCSLTPLDDYTLVKGREQVFEFVPKPGDEFTSAWRADSPGALSYYLVNWIRKFGKPFDREEWSAQVVKRLRSWGFNSGGAWTTPTSAMKKLSFPYTLMLPTEHIPGLPPVKGIDRLFDPFDPASARLIEEAFARYLPDRVDDPLIIGYFLGNEQLFENLPKVIPALDGKSASKRRLVELLRTRYGNDIARFNTAWQPKTPLSSFNAMSDTPLEVSSRAAAGDMKEFYALFVDTYYDLVSTLFKKYDRNHLLLGSRWQPGTANNEILVRTAAKYVDVISVNYYTYAVETSFLQRIHGWSAERPMLLSEWHYTCTDQGLAGGKEVSNQRERGLAYRNYVETVGALPFVIGSQWFSYVDQSITGRWFEGFRGEGANIGLVNVADRPYLPFVNEAKITNDEIYDIIFAKRAPFQFDDPRFTGRAGAGRKVMAVAKATEGLQVDGASGDWPGIPPETLTAKNISFGTVDETFSASCRFCWDETFLYLLVDVNDRTPRQNDRTAGNLWMGDGVELFIGYEDPDEAGELRFSDRQILLGAGAQPSIHFAKLNIQPTDARIAVADNVTTKGYTIEAAIPWKALDIVPAKGAEILFDIAVNDSEDGLNRRRQLMWNGSSRNSSDRGGWGRAKLN